MRHAFLTTAYKNPRHLLRMMDLFDERFDFFIHIDARSRISPDDSELLANHPRCRLVSRRYVNRWGGVNHLMAMLHLAGAALRSGAYDYLHVRSGQDYPIRSAEAIDGFFSDNMGLEFVESFPFPDPAWGEDGGFERIRTFQLQTYLDVKNPRIGRWADFLHRLQRRLGVRRRPPVGFPALHGGSQWVSFTGELWQDILDQWKERPNWYRFFRFSFCAEEIVLPSLAHAFKGGTKVSGRWINYVDWSFRNGSNPANLDESDFEAIQCSDCLFVRKVEYPFSAGLLDRIDRQMLGR